MFNGTCQSLWYHCPKTLCALTFYLSLPIIQRGMGGKEKPLKKYKQGSGYMPWNHPTLSWAPATTKRRAKQSLLSTDLPGRSWVMWIGGLIQKWLCKKPSPEPYWRMESGSSWRQASTMSRVCPGVPFPQSFLPTETTAWFASMA